MAKRPTFLRIDNPAEDVPRRIQGTGRTPRGGTWGLVVLPHEQRTLLMVADKRTRGQPQTFRTWSSLEGATGEGRVDVVGDPVVDADPDGSMAALHKMGHMKLGPRTDITLKGRWKGTLRWAKGLPADGVPVVELTRAVSSYVTLVVRSFVTDAGTPAWRWMIKRDAQWFATESGDFGEALTFKGAVATALRQMEGVVGEACTVRDTRRRGALQASYSGRVGRVREAPVTGRGVDRFAPAKGRTSAARPPKAKAKAGAAPRVAKAPDRKPTLAVVHQPSPSPIAATGSPMLDVVALKKRTAKHTEAWKAKLDEKRAKSWVRSALHHMGLGKAELDAGPGPKLGHAVVTVQAVSDVPPDTAARVAVVEGARPVGLALKWSMGVEGALGAAPTAPPVPAPAPAPAETFTTPGGVSTWPDVVGFLDQAYADGGVPAQPAPGGLSRKDMARAIAEALRTGQHHELIRTSQKLTTKAVASLLGLKGKSRPRSNKAWAALFQGTNLLPHLTGTISAPAAGATTYTPLTERDVRNLTQGEAKAFLADPTPDTAKAWIAAALRLADLWAGASDVVLTRRLVEGVFVARVVLFTNSTDHPDEDRADMAAVVAAAPEGLVIEEWRWSDGVFPEPQAPTATPTLPSVRDEVRKRTKTITAAYLNKATAGRARGWVRAAMIGAGIWDDAVTIRVDANPHKAGAFVVDVVLASETPDHIDADLAAIAAIEAESPAGLSILNWTWRDQLPVSRASQPEPPPKPAPQRSRPKPAPAPAPAPAKPASKTDKNAIIAAAAKAEVGNQMALFFGSPQ